MDMVIAGIVTVIVIPSLYPRIRYLRRRRGDATEASR